MEIRNRNSACGVRQQTGPISWYEIIYMSKRQKSLQKPRPALAASLRRPQLGPDIARDVERLGGATTVAGAASGGVDRVAVAAKITQNDLFFSDMFCDHSLHETL